MIRISKTVVILSSLISKKFANFVNILKDIGCKHKQEMGWIYLSSVSPIDDQNNSFNEAFNLFLNQCIINTR